MQREIFRRKLHRKLGGHHHVIVPSDADLRPLHWSKYFERADDIRVSNGDNVFRVYSNKLNESRQDTFVGPAVILLHGAGYSGLTWSLFAHHIVSLCECASVAIDLRGHGSSLTTDDHNLSTNTLIHDINDVLCNLYLNTGQQHDQQTDDDHTSSQSYGYTPHVNQIRPPPLILVGHSMGGALAVHLSHLLIQNQQFDVRAVVVIDVVEGTAMAALECMHNVLMGRPSWFRSITDAIRWCLSSGQTKNYDAARVSFPGQIKNAKNHKTASDEIPIDVNMIEPEVDPIAETTASSSSLSIAEEDENEMDTDSDGSSSSILQTNHNLNDNNNLNQGGFVWRIDLTKSAPFWKGWFENLSNLFLTAPVQNRLLILAGMDRLDKDLTIGQMQGKFQLQVLPQVGHAVHEDNPIKVAEIIAQFLVKNKITTAKQTFELTFPCC